MAQINKPTDYFNTITYSGNGSSPRSITGVGFQPDLNWTKSRSAGGSHVLANAISGANKQLISNNANAEATNGTYGYLSAFDSDGWSMTTGSNDFSRMNTNSTTYVSWNWLAGGSASSNTDGSITSTVSANTTSGFSIVSYTGTGSTATIGHGLGVSPSMIILKSLDRADNWWVYHKGLSNPSTKAILLNSTNAEFTPGTSAFNTSTFSSSVFGILTDGASNASGEDYIAYCFAEKTGYSKFGSYTGNGNADGTFVYTGFKPAFTILKKSSGTDNWVLHDNKRSDVPNANVNDQVVYPNDSAAELSSSTRAIDTVSNGFKCRGSGGNINASGSTYIYMAFAEEPLVGTNNIPATAR